MPPFNNSMLALPVTERGRDSRHSISNPLRPSITMSQTNPDYRPLDIEPGGRQLISICPTCFHLSTERRLREPSTGQPQTSSLPRMVGNHVWRAAVAMPFITFAFVALRFYTRAYLVKTKFTFDNHIVILTTLICIAHAVLMAIATYNGMGLHVWQFDQELNSRYYLWIGITSEFYVLGLCGFKCALLLLYPQLFGVDSRFRRTCHGTLFFCVGYLFCNMITEFLGCHPINKKWEPVVPGECVDSIVAATFYGACNIASDLVIAILPLTMIWRLQLPTRRQKLGLSLVLSCGFIAWAVAVIRWGMATYDLIGTSDRPWCAGISFTLSILEINTGLICACAATLGPLWKSAYACIKGWSSRCGSDVSSWPSSLHNHRRGKSRKENGNGSRPSERWMNPTVDVSGHQTNRTSNRNTIILLHAGHEDEHGLLDMPDTHISHARENRSQQGMEDV